MGYVEGVSFIVIPFLRTKIYVYVGSSEEKYPKKYKNP